MMMKRGRVIRFAVNSTLLAAIVALGITVYQAGTSKIPEEGSLYTEEEPVQEGELEVNVGSSQVEVELESNQSQICIEEANNSDYLTGNQETILNESGVSILEQASNTISLDFTEDSLMEWPVEGKLLMDYSMDQTVYFQTLDQYKVNPAILVQAEEGRPVLAAAKGQVVAVEETQETGTTVTLDLGNGYTNIYGQLENVQVKPGDMVEQMQVMASISLPSKYYTKEGSSLYFAMTKNGTPIDPLIYLP